MRTAKKDSSFYEVFSAYDLDGIDKVTGLTTDNSDFSITFYKNGGTVSAPTYTITEIGSSGDYAFEATFASIGYWSVYISTILEGEIVDVFKFEVEVTLRTIDEVYDAVIGGGIGSETLVVTVQDTTNSNAVVPSVALNVYNADKTAFITFGTTNTLGQKSFALDPGTYTVMGYLPGYSFTDASVTVSDTNGATQQSLTFSSAGISITPPTTPGLCRVYADFVNQSGAAVSDFRISVTNLFDPPSAQGLSVIEKVTHYKTNASGHVEMDLVQGLTVRIALLSTSITRDVVIPSTTTANLFDILGPASDPFRVVEVPSSSSFVVVGVG
tara:strand:+ start:17036 stop:18016 length:981 start_codon:yes stop_codon:yes gene_type:complete